MAITQDRLVQLLAAAQHFDKAIQTVLGQCKALTKVTYLNGEEKFDAMRALCEAEFAHSQANIILCKESVHYQVHGRANERKKLLRQQKNGKPRERQFSEPTLPIAPEPTLQHSTMLDNLEDEVLQNYRAMLPENRANYFRDADQHSRSIIAAHYPEMAKTMESELSTQHLEAQMKRSPQDFFSANLPVGQNQ